MEKTLEQLELERLDAELAALEARKAARMQAQVLSDKRRAVHEAEQAEQLDEAVAAIKADHPEWEHGLHFLVRRYGDALVQVQIDKGAQSIYYKNLPQAGGLPSAAVVRNYVRDSLLLREGEDRKAAIEHFNAVDKDFPGMPIDLANALIDMSKGRRVSRAEK
jgi:hypothetical protein